MKKFYIIFVLILGFLIFKIVLSQATTTSTTTENEFILETPYAAEGSAEELIQLKESGDIKTFQEKFEDFVISVFPSLEPPVISDIRIENITTSLVTILWKTNVKSNSVVSLAEDKDYDSKKENPYVFEVANIEERVKEHKVVVSNLKPATLYHFQVKSLSLSGVIGKSKNFTFSTKASKSKLEVTKVSNDEISVKWITPVQTNSILEYKNLKTGKLLQEKLSEKTLIHLINIKNLSPGTEYLLKGFGYTDKNIIIETDELTVKTRKDTTPPKIYDIKISNALVSTSKNQALTIVSWKTDEPANSIVYYEAGFGSIDKLTNKVGKEDNFVKEHTVIIPTKAGSIYRIKVVSVDRSNNKSESSVRTVLTPKTEASILEIIIKNFEQTFKFLKRK